MSWGTKHILCDFPGCTKRHPVELPQQGGSETVAFMAASEAAQVKGWFTAYSYGDPKAPDFCPVHHKAFNAWVENLAEESEALGRTPNRDQIRARLLRTMPRQFAGVQS